MAVSVKIRRAAGDDGEQAVGFPRKCFYLHSAKNSTICITANFFTRTVPKFIDTFFAKTSPKRSFSVIENKRFGLVFAKTGSINSGTDMFFK
jgi:hypothetical protein